MSTLPTIGIIWTPRIGKINTSYPAGTEQLFTRDIQALKKTGYTLHPYARGYAPVAHSLFYPIKYVTRFLRNESHVNTIETILETIALSIFCIKTRACGVWIGYSTPLLALFRPKRTIIIMQTCFDIPLARIYASRYQKAHFVFCSQSMQRDYIKKYSWMNKCSSVLYNSINTNRFHPEKQNNRASTLPLHLLFVSAWVPEKGLDVLLKALKTVPMHARKNIFLTIASNESLWYSDFPQLNQSFVQRIKRSIKTGKNIHLLGGVSQSQMPGLYRSHDALVFPSVWAEPFGLSILESLSCGTPVIAFDSGGIKELLDATKSLLVKSKTPTALANSIFYAYNHRNIFQNHDTSLVSSSRFTDAIRLKKYMNFIYKRTT